MIADIIRVNQPDVYQKLQEKYNYKFSHKRKTHKKNNKTKKVDTLELMGVNRPIYKRGKGGAMKQA